MIWNYDNRTGYSEKRNNEKGCSPSHATTAQQVQCVSEITHLFSNKTKKKNVLFWNRSNKFKFKTVFVEGINKTFSASKQSVTQNYWLVLPRIHYFGHPSSPAGSPVVLVMKVDVRKYDMKFYSSDPHRECIWICRVLPRDGPSQISGPGRLTFGVLWTDILQNFRSRKGLVNIFQEARPNWG
jgi:hypothetical protein